MPHRGYTRPMEPFEVEEALAGGELVAVSQGSLTDVKRQVEQCLEHGIPARAGSQEGCASGSCQPKAQLMVRRQRDVTLVSVEKEFV